MDIPRNWTFESAHIAAGFDRHVREQLPWYDLVSGGIAHIARHYIPKHGRVYDIGASTGNIGRAIEQTIQDRQAEFIAIESSIDMVNQYQGPGTIINENAVTFNYQNFDFAVLFLVLMFIPKVQRLLFLSNLRKSLNPGGAIVIFDKVEAAHGYFSTVLWRLTLAGKVAAGVQADEIIRKELSLSGIQRPLQIREIYADSKQWFQFGDFAGWIVEG